MKRFFLALVCAVMVSLGACMRPDEAAPTVAVPDATEEPMPVPVVGKPNDEHERRRDAVRACIDACPPNWDSYTPFDTPCRWACREKE